LVALVRHTKGTTEQVVFANGVYKQELFPSAKATPLDEMIAKTIVNITKMFPNHAN
jgi:hypothetical protein